MSHTVLASPQIVGVLIQQAETSPRCTAVVILCSYLCTSTSKGIDVEMDHLICYQGSLGVALLIFRRLDLRLNHCQKRLKILHGDMDQSTMRIFLMSRCIAASSLGSIRYLWWPNARSLLQANPWLRTLSLPRHSEQKAA